jgi:hypothetical protein
MINPRAAATVITAITEKAKDVADDGLLVTIVVALVDFVVVAVLIAHRAHSPSKHARVMIHTLGPLYNVYV